LRDSPERLPTKGFAVAPQGGGCTEAEVCRLYQVIQEKVVDGHARSTLLRSTFVIDKKGVVRHILQDVNPKAHVGEVLKVCRELSAKTHAN